MSRVVAVPVAIISARHWPMAGAKLKGVAAAADGEVHAFHARRTVDDHAPVGRDRVQARPACHDLGIREMRHPVRPAVRPPP